MRIRHSGLLLFTTVLFVGCSDSMAPSNVLNDDVAEKAGSATCETRPNDNLKKLLECVTVDGVRSHQAAFQAIADANGGTRAAGTPGYQASATYVADAMIAAGYDVTLNTFPFTYTPPATLEQLTPFSATYQTGAFTGSGYGDVTAPVEAVDIGGSPNTSGCEAGDFAGFPPGHIALIRRGTCTFAEKAINAEASGAIAVIIFNDGISPEREGLIVGTLGGSNVVGIPVVGASTADGLLLALPDATAHVHVPTPVTISQANVIAESRWGDPTNVVMAGAHLDAVPAGPGIQDNGSGSAALLEIAKQMANARTRNKVRFAWWGAEEAGLVGSTAYVNGLSGDELNRIALYLNFDMIGSPNHVFFIYDGDDSDGVGAGPGPDGSAEIEQTFEAYFDARGLPYKGADFTGRSDYGPFIWNNVPSGGLFTGAEGVKTAEEESIWGGTAGISYDPCYHQACDTYDNINLFALDVNSDAAAHAILSFAQSTSIVNGIKGKGNFEPQMDNQDEQ